MKSIVSLLVLFFNLAAQADVPPTFEIVLGEVAQNKIRLLFEGAINENPFLIEGTTANGEPCTIRLESSSDSTFSVSIEDKALTKVVIGKSTSLTRATRDFNDYFSEHYKLFIPSAGGYDVIEHRKKHENDDFQLVISSSMHQDKWVSCGSSLK